MSKVLKEIDGTIRIDNMQQALLTKLINKMQQTDSGHCVCRQFVYGKPYTMLLTDVSSAIDSAKVIVTVALWPDEKDATYYINRQIPFYVRTENVHVWEDFCEAVSGSRAIWENDLIGNFFVGHIVKNKSYYDGKAVYFENLVVDKFIGRLDLAKATEIVKNKREKQKPVMKKPNPDLVKLLDDEEE